MRVQVHAPDRNTTKAGLPSRLAASHVVHTGQVFFPEDLLTRLEDLAPYSLDPVKRTLNKDDGLYREVTAPVLLPYTLPLCTLNDTVLLLPAFG